MVIMVELILKSKRNILDKCLLILCLVFSAFVTFDQRSLIFTKSFSWLKLFEIIRKSFCQNLIPILVSDIWRHLLTLFCLISLVWPLHRLFGQLILINGILLVNELLTAESSSKNAKFYTEEDYFFVFFKALSFWIVKSLELDLHLYIELKAHTHWRQKHLDFEYLGCKVNFNGYYEHTRSWQRTC